MAGITGVNVIVTYNHHLPIQCLDFSCNYYYIELVIPQKSAS
ncbi:MULTISPECIES: hypothetical protein [Enterococcus]|nr:MULTISPECIES: hypothetical protein [Enterococcus]MCU1906236.1 hypothetical protein [Enterococcus faecium]MCU1914239.1 hypothetical protein [Enterococcus faecium]MCU1917274.1 hypothetical protein [Enterococcus faecium]MCU1928280.1 hypothetical protein [Enterococcus faecium]MCU2002777.1 hypothetical protein [Enterococcus faecium]